MDTEQQSLAIGKRGQNVRLAARLVGWDIDIRSEEDMKREIAHQMEQMLTAEVVPVTFIEGITPNDSAILSEHGIETIEQLAAANVDDLCDWLDLSYDDAEEMIGMVGEIVAVREAALAQEEADAEALAAEAVEAEVEEDATVVEAVAETTETVNAEADIVGAETPVEAHPAEAEEAEEAEVVDNNDEIKAEEGEDKG